MRQADLCAVDLPRAAAAAQLVDDLVDLAEAGRADRLALRQQASRRVDRQPAAEARRAGLDERAALAGRAEAELLRRNDLGAAVGVLQLDDVDVVGAEARRLVR